MLEDRGERISIFLTVNTELYNLNQSERESVAQLNFITFKCKKYVHNKFLITTNRLFIIVTFLIVP